MDAFAEEAFTGNPAAVCLLDRAAQPAWMQSVAAGTNLPMTAFAGPRDEPGAYDLRWFTPVTEVRLCGHATLASAHVLWGVGAVAPALRSPSRPPPGSSRRSATGGSWRSTSRPAGWPRRGRPRGRPMRSASTPSGPGGPTETGSSRRSDRRMSSARAPTPLWSERLGRPVLTCHQGLSVTLTCTAAGGNAVWATQRPDPLGGTPALLFRLSQTDLATVAGGTLPAGASPGAVQCVTVGGGLVWVTDGVGSLFKIQP